MYLKKFNENLQFSVNFRTPEILILLPETVISCLPPGVKVA